MCVCVCVFVCVCIQGGWKWFSYHPAAMLTAYVAIAGVFPMCSQCVPNVFLMCCNLKPRVCVDVCVCVCVCVCV